MKKKTFLKSLGAVCLVGGASAATYLFLKKSKEPVDKKMDQCGEIDEAETETQRETALSLSNTEMIDDLKSVKVDVVEEIKDRHEAAASEMKESLEHILDETPVTETENTEMINEMVKDIEKLV